MNRLVLFVARCAAGAALIGGAAFLLTARNTDSTAGIDSRFGRLLLALDLLLACALVALPRWRAWILLRPWLAAFLTASTIGWIATGQAGGALALLLGLLSAACMLAATDAARGRWITAALASSVIAISMLSLLAPPPSPFAVSPIDLLGRMHGAIALSALAAGFALLLGGWVNAPERSLGLPRWAGLSLVILLAALSTAAWHRLQTESLNSIRRESAANERALAAFIRENFSRLASSMLQFSKTLDAPVAIEEGDLEHQSTLLRGAHPSLVMLQWVEHDGKITWADEDVAAARASVPAASADEAIARAHSSREVSFVGPIGAGGDGSALVAATPAGSRGSLVALISVRRGMGPWTTSFNEPYETEVFFEGRMVWERGGRDGPSIATPGQTITVGSNTLQARVAPTESLLAGEAPSLPNLLFAAMLATSALLGSTTYFAQVSAQKARGSARVQSQLEQLIAGGGQVAIIATDTNGRITIFNRGAERLTGRTAPEVIRRMDAADLFEAAELRKALEPHVSASPREALAALAQEVRGFSADWTWQRPSGGSRRVNVAASPWRDVRGELLGYLLVAVDVTEREAAMRALDRARTDLERTNTLKTSFLSNVSHEIRTPMTSILGCADLLLEEGAPELERAEFARTIRRNGEHLLEVLNDILDITRIEAGRLRIERIEVKLGEVLDEVSTLMSARAKARQLAFTIHRETADDPAVLTDPLRIRQVLVNLIGNAIKFTERGSVTVTLRTRIEGDNLCADFIVRDTGIGISPEQAASLFVDFAQATPSTARRHGGTGLGLAISQRLAHLLDGSITLHSELGSGSAFTFSLRAPLTTAAIAVAPEDAAQPIRLDGRDVLLLGLQEHAGDIAAVLKQSGASVLSVNTPSEAFAAADLTSQHERFNAILIDMRLPDLAGYDTARELRASGYRGRLIALTEEPALDDRDRCIAAGFDDQGVLPLPRAQLLRLCSPAIATRDC